MKALLVEAWYSEYWPLEACRSEVWRSEYWLRAWCSEAWPLKACLGGLPWRLAFLRLVLKACFLEPCLGGLSGGGLSWRLGRCRLGFWRLVLEAWQAEAWHFS